MQTRASLHQQAHMGGLLVVIAYRLLRLMVLNLVSGVSHLQWYFLHSPMLHHFCNTLSVYLPLYIPNCIRLCKLALVLCISAVLTCHACSNCEMRSENVDDFLLGLPKYHTAGLDPIVETPNLGFGSPSSKQAPVYNISLNHSPNGQTPRGAFNYALKSIPSGTPKLTSNLGVTHVGSSNYAYASSMPLRSSLTFSRRVRSQLR